MTISPLSDPIESLLRCVWGIVIPKIEFKGFITSFEMDTKLNDAKQWNHLFVEDFAFSEFTRRSVHARSVPSGNVQMTSCQVHVHLMSEFDVLVGV